MQHPFLSEFSVGHRDAYLVFLTRTWFRMLFHVKPPGWHRTRFHWIPNFGKAQMLYSLHKLDQGVLSLPYWRKSDLWRVNVCHRTSCYTKYNQHNQTKDLANPLLSNVVILCPLFFYSGQNAIPYSPLLLDITSKLAGKRLPGCGTSYNIFPTVYNI